MTIKTLNILFFFLLLFLTEVNAQTLKGQLGKLSDASNDTTFYQSGTYDSISYETVLTQWKTVANVNNWIKENFRYSFERAKQLADNSPTREQLHIYSPAELYHTKKGVCIDLARFAVETITILDTSKHIQYLMIEFEPINIDGSIIKKHWMTVYRDSSGYYFLADSKRPGLITGPYRIVDDFITDYQTFRERKIVSWKILISYMKQKSFQQKSKKMS